MGRTDGALMERVRQPTPLDEERRSALWLYAWSVSASHARRHSGLRPEADRAH
ncbi:MAG: hypothetical protein ACJ76T_02080 [Solirubrobacteraceae bacterium]